VLDVEPRTGFDKRLDTLGTRNMSKRSRHEALSCPSTVTVHDKTHVFWNCAQSMIFIAK
jgi:hypothetical protein